MPKFIRFTDRAGGRWRAYEFSIAAGIVQYFAPGARSGQYRGFVPEPTDARPRRRYMLFKADERRIDPATLQLQLELSDLDPRDDPTHPLNRCVRGD